VPPPSPPSAASQPASVSPRTALLLLAALVAVVVAFFAGRATPIDTRLPSSSSSRVEVRPTPNVLLAVRDLARLESATFHMERVVEMTDEQSKLFGLVRARDTLLLVAVGDVVAGVDLRKLGEGDIMVDAAKGDESDALSASARAQKPSVRIILPAPEIFSATLDSAKTHVFNRATDTFASRNEDLEGKARADAEASMQKAALDQGILERARVSAERELRALLRSLGFEVIELQFAP
jgi:hypothetical protein